ncbi:hypothetical protein BWI97_15685 [Siphonobacter sp. BAB-5405]|uniref:hypothetical protein n=1 Tax=Siphonobacter sp. BAB-5405 TaxID=1864825 RepID=UPI000C801180|nr:hypothetical protein [Siphonobacter sp. BAB-5405]PMD94837.1 hypothetical protein BWI97_15685 [Siphonobacter sp. BAB-5405]
MTDSIYADNGTTVEIPALREELPVYFRLVHNDDIVYIDEPAHWDELELTAKRDTDWHGFNFDYTDGETELAFTCSAGRGLIEDVYKVDGPDGQIFLEVTTLPPSQIVHVVEYRYRLNLATRARKDYIVTCEIERDTLHEKVKARWENTVNLFEAKTLDGVAIDPMPVYDLPLHGKVIQQKFSAVVTSQKLTEQTFQGDTNGHVWVSFDTSEPSVSEIKEAVAGKPFGISDSEGPVHFDEYLFKFESEGDYRFKISLDFTVDFSIKKRAVSIGAKKITSWFLDAFLVLDTESPRGASPTKFLRIGTRQSGGGGGTSVTGIRLQGAIDEIVHMKAGWRAYLYGILHFEHNANELASTTVKVRCDKSAVEVIASTYSDGSLCRAVWLKDAIERTLTQITGQTKVLEAPYYSFASSEQPVAGCGANRMITNGFQIRQFEPDKHGVEVTLKTLLTACKAWDGIGFEYTNDEEGNQIIRLLPREQFYADVEIIDLGECSDYSEETAAELLYNRVQVGYQKYFDEGLNGLDEFSTVHEYTLPTLAGGDPYQKDPNKLELLSPIRADGYGIESVRRVQFEKTPTDSTSEDDELFVVCTTPPTGSTMSVLAEISDGSLGGFYLKTVTKLPNVRLGALVKVQSPLNSGTFKVLNDGAVRSAPVGTYLNWENKYVYWIDGTPNPESQTQMMITIASSPASSERNESFASVAGIISPETAYNLRLTPKRMLLANGPLVSIGLAYKKPDQILKNGYAKQNGDLVAALSASDACATEYEPVTEKADVTVEQVRGQIAKYSPEFVYFSKRLSRKTFMLIRQALRGKATPETNYGYVTVTNDLGERVSGYVMEMKYKPLSEQVDFKLLKKFVPSQPPILLPECSDYADWTFLDFENTTDDVRKLEECRFDDFS